MHTNKQVAQSQVATDTQAVAGVENTTPDVKTAVDTAAKQGVDEPKKTKVEANAAEAEAEEKPTKVLTQEEVDRIIAERLKRERERWEKRLEQEREMAKLSEEERHKRELELKEQEIKERERQIRLKENQLEAIKELTQNNIPADFVEFVVHEDKEVMHKRLEALKTQWQTALQKAVKEHLKGSAPVDVAQKKATPKVDTPTVL